MAVGSKMNRRSFLKLGALFVPVAAAIVEPRRVYSFLWAKPENWLDVFAVYWNLAPREWLESDERMRDRILDVVRMRPTIDGLYLDNMTHAYLAGQRNHEQIRW